MQIYKKAEIFYNKLIEIKLIYFLISFAILSSYYILYTFRDLDTAVLMAWHMVFHYRPINIYELLLILSIVIFISFLISRINIFNKYNEEKYHILFLFFQGLLSDRYSGIYLKSVLMPQGTSQRQNIWN